MLDRNFEAHVRKLVESGALDPSAMRKEELRRHREKTNEFFSSPASKVNTRADSVECGNPLCLCRNFTYIGFRKAWRCDHCGQLISTYFVGETPGSSNRLFIQHLGFGGCPKKHTPDPLGRRKK